MGSDGVTEVSTDGVSWFQGGSGKTLVDGGDAFNRIAYGNGQFVVVAGDYDEQSLAVFSSSDGVNWVKRLAGPPLFSMVGGADSYSIAYGNGRFVIVPYDSRDVSATSADGVNWGLTPTGATIIDGVEAVTYGNGQFVSVAVEGTIAISTNGVNWVQRQAGTTNISLFGIAYGNGQFVAVGGTFESNSFSSVILTSSDGVNWVQRQPGTGWVISSVAYGNGEFVAVGGTILTSIDGVNWVERPPGPAAVSRSWQLRRTFRARKSAADIFKRRTRKTFFASAAIIAN